MSVVMCQVCHKRIDSDLDTDCFISPHEVRCKTCREGLSLQQRAELAFCSSDPTLVEELADELARTNEALAACQSQAAGRIRVLEAALASAVEVIKVWHNMDGAAAEAVWPLYYKNAPEMAPIRDTIAAAGAS